MSDVGSLPIDAKWMSTNEFKVCNFRGREEIKTSQSGFRFRLAVS